MYQAGKVWGSGLSSEFDLQVADAKEQAQA
jgi:hypothetical protein